MRTWVAHEVETLLQHQWMSLNKLVEAEDPEASTGVPCQVVSVPGHLALLFHQACGLNMICVTAQ